VKNDLDGRTYGRGDTVAGRASAKWDVIDDLAWTVRVDYARTNGDGVALNQADTSTASARHLANFAARIGEPGPLLAYPPGRHVSQFMTNLNLKDTQYGLNSDLSFKFGGGYTLRLINAYRDWKNIQTDGDVVFTPLDLISRDASFKSRSQSHELQLLSPEGALLDGRLDFVAGLYHFQEDYEIGEAFNLGGRYCSFAVAAAAPALVGACNAGPKVGAAQGVFTQDAKSTAVYAQATYAVTDSLDLILGARQTWDDKSGDFVQTISNPAVALLRAPETAALEFDDSQPNWRASLSWRPTGDVTAFVTYSTGYKSGGLNSAGGAQPLGAKRLFDSEKSSDWEGGVKSVLFDRRLLLNVTLYRTRLEDFQERAFDGVSFIVRNAGTIRAQGVELEGQARPFTGMAVDFGAAYLDSVFTANHAAPGLPACNNSPRRARPCRT
jgi:iron complex outermembrane receptor protein